MSPVINVKQLRRDMPKIIRRVAAGTRFTVLYRSRAAFQIVPPEPASSDLPDLASDPIYRAGPLGRSASGDVGAAHDERLYRR
ncbi:MAG: hypothetical protein JXR37_19300 [Kiritimatiellae bacterium]|nr:hypothetical protein [Kiritimatiellia bacterium]